MSTTDTTAAAAPPAGWYPDPTGRHERRWWDGETWTTEVADPVDPSEGGDPLEALPPVVPPEPEATEPDDEPEASFEDRPGRRPPAERPSTGAGLAPGPSRRGLILTVVGVAVVVASLLWGYDAYTKADKWRDRGEELQTRLDDTSSNADAVEAALTNAASRGARIADSFQQVGELREATDATIHQLNDCINILNGLLNTVSTGGDPTTAIEQANQVCGAAGMNGTTLIQILEELEQG